MLHKKYNNVSVRGDRFEETSILELHLFGSSEGHVLRSYLRATVAGRSGWALRYTFRLDIQLYVGFYLFFFPSVLSFFVVNGIVLYFGIKWVGDVVPI